MAYSKKSPWVIHYDGSSCNGCDIEVLATLCPGFDAERFGVINTGNPKHADIFLVTGSINEQNKSVVKQIYDQMIEPKVVVACGICACTGGVFKECYNVLGGVDKAIPVDVYVPGCAVRPESIIDAVVAGIEALDAKSEALKKKKYKKFYEEDDDDKDEENKSEDAEEKVEEDKDKEEDKQDEKKPLESKESKKADEEKDEEKPEETKKAKKPADAAKDSKKEGSDSSKKNSTTPQKEE